MIMAMMLIKERVAVMNGIITIVLPGKVRIIIVIPTNQIDGLQ